MHIFKLLKVAFASSYLFKIFLKQNIVSVMHTIGIIISLPVCLYETL